MTHKPRPSCTLSLRGRLSVHEGHHILNARFEFPCRAPQRTSTHGWDPSCARHWHRRPASTPAGHSSRVPGPGHHPLPWRYGCPLCSEPTACPTGWLRPKHLPSSNPMPGISQRSLALPLNHRGGHFLCYVLASCTYYDCSCILPCEGEEQL